MTSSSTGDPRPWMPMRGRVLRRSEAVRARADEEHRGLTTLLLDLGGVVLPTLFEVIDDPTFPAGPFGDDDLYDGVESGRLQERDYWAHVATLRPDLDIRYFMQTRLRVRDEIRTLLGELEGQAKVAALTNDMGHWFGSDWPTKFPDFCRFDVLLEAAGSGVLKPDPAVFRWALSVLDERADRCLFVDDLSSNLVGARMVGMKVEHFAVGDPAGSTRRILQRFAGGGTV